ncbi:membrane insertase COX18 Ecym_6272 [Eremothecium cymbalariae DBVPG|uniref:Mitochondrial inner membrane protein COX18 n=1 Tax=Eremothecium cymbalariae (strain CBS 270.75 / DBVPG 7215 / KCTC 17166 / NRRL Y-17582) TaxID=931890 RepID=G8JVH4_ERECY|nr:hypothetical protein Ecym_6272 [Eremothecium cymbalariae DBVPG\
MIRSSVRQIGFSVSNRRQFSALQTVADSFAQLHDMSGVPWLVLVPISTFTLRSLVTLPLSIWQRRRIVKQQELKKVVQAVAPVVRLRLAAAVNGATPENITSAGSVVRPEEITTTVESLKPEQIIMLSIKETRKRQKALFKKYGVQMWKNSVLPLVQVPLWVTLSMGIRQLTEQSLIDTHITGTHALAYLMEANVISTLGSLDLSLPLSEMPLLIPIVLGTLIMVNVEYNGKVMEATTNSLLGIETAKSSTSKSSRMFSSLLGISRLSSIFLMGVSSQAPILLSLYWISSQLYSLIQNKFLDWLWPYQR